MSYLRDFTLKKNLPVESLSSSDRFSIFYHNIFKYPLTFSELFRWSAKNVPEVPPRIGCKNGYYFIEGSEGLIYKRAVRKRYSQNKTKIARKAAKLISLIPSIKMVGLTGSLAMENADKGGDIDLILITKNGKLWTSRIIVYTILKLFGFRLRSPLNSRQKDRLCLNIWLDETDLGWRKKERNFYTAHEILQTIPLVDKKGTFERFLSENKWALDFWPNAAEIRITKNNSSYTKQRRLNLIESLAYKAQLSYMKTKVTREIVKPTRAIFHPNDLSKEIIGKMPLTDI